MTKQSTVPFYARLDALEVGQWKPAKFTPLDDYNTVVLLVPLTGENVYNAEQIIREQMSGKNETTPIWTEKGFEFILRTLNNACMPDVVKPEDFTSEDKPKEVKDEDW